jgi:spore germination protein Q
MWIMVYPNMNANAPFGRFPTGGYGVPGMSPYGTFMSPATPMTGAAAGTGMMGVPPIPAGSAIPTAPVIEGPPTAEESYIENILRYNRGKIGTFYMTFENNTQWNAKVFRGRVETAGRDHIIISDPQTGKRYILLMVNLDFVEFDSELAYIPPAIPPMVQAELATTTTTPVR